MRIVIRTMEYRRCGRSDVKLPPFHGAMAQLRRCDAGKETGGRCPRFARSIWVALPTLILRQPIMGRRRAPQNAIWRIAGRLLPWHSVK